MKRQDIIVKGIIFSEDRKKIILLKTNRNYWDLPGGHLEFGETPEECLIREAYEEAGIRVEIETLCSTDTIILLDKHKDSVDDVHYQVLCYTGKINNTEIFKVSDDVIIEAIWINPSEIEKFNIIPILVDQINSALNKPNHIFTHKKYFMFKGEIDSYNIIEYGGGKNGKIDKKNGETE